MPMSKTYKNRLDRVDGCFLFWLTVFLRSDTIPYNNNEYLAYSLQIGA